MRGYTKVISAVVLSVGAFFAINAVTGKSYAADCSDNAVVRCGVNSTADTISAYNNNGSVRDIFNYMVGVSNSKSGMSSSASSVINAGRTREGYVTKDGQIVVNGAVVADQALSSGRQSIGASTRVTSGSTTFYTRTPSVSFVSSQISAVVFFDSQDRFVLAVLWDCGNAVAGRNKVVPPTPKPTPVYTCDSLTATVTNRTDRRFTVKYTATNGATVRDFTWDYGDGTTETFASDYVNHTYAKPGTYTAKVTVRFVVDGKVVTAPTNVKCSVPVTIDQPETPKNPGVSIDKKVDGTDGPKEMTVGQVFDYTLLVTNTGDVDLTHVVVTDPAPSGVQFISTDKGSIDANKLTYTIDKLAVKASQTITIKAKVTVSTDKPIVNQACVDATEVPGDKDDCDDVTITVKPKDVQRCEIATGTIVTISEKEAEDTTKYAPADSDKCKDVEMCEIATGATVTISKDAAKDTTKYAPVGSDKCKVKVCNPSTGEIITVDKKDEGNYDDVDNDACKPTPPAKCEVPGKEHLNKDDENCKETPPTPVVELPKTGLTTVLSGVTGLGALTAATYYYVMSSRRL